MRTAMGRQWIFCRQLGIAFGDFLSRVSERTCVFDSFKFVLLIYSTSKRALRWNFGAIGWYRSYSAGVPVRVWILQRWCASANPESKRV